MDNIDKLKKDNEILRKALVRLVGSEAPEELAAIEAALRLMPMNEDDKAASINAIHAIIETQIPPLDDKVCTCSKCGSPSAGLHSCPYASEINNNDDLEYCDCCENCTSNCADDI